jgi:hypothetical protein
VVPEASTSASMRLFRSEIFLSSVLPFDGRDLGRIGAQRDEVPGTDEDTVLVGAERYNYRCGRSKKSPASSHAVIEHLTMAWKGPG